MAAVALLERVEEVAGAPGLAFDILPPGFPPAGDARADEGDSAVVQTVQRVEVAPACGGGQGQEALDGEVAAAAYRLVQLRGEASRGSVAAAR